MFFYGEIFLSTAHRTEFSTIAFSPNPVPGKNSTFFFQRHILHLLKGAVEDVGWEVIDNESVVRAQHRVELLSTACHLEQVECFEQSVRLYTSWMMTSNPDTFNE